MKGKLIKRYIFIIIAVICALSVIAPAASAQTGIRVFIDGVLITPRDARGNIVEPLIIDGTTYLPVRAIGESFGMNVHWDGAAQSVFVGTRPTEVPPRADHIRVFINGTLITPRDVLGRVVHPFIRNGTTFLPVRAIGEAFDKDIHWDARNQSVFVGPGTFTITIGRRTHTVTMADIISLIPRPVTAHSGANEQSYMGVPLAAVFNRLGLHTNAVSYVVFTSEGGATTTLPIDVARDHRNTFIIVEYSDGQPLGTMDASGSGPFMVVVTLDPSPNRSAMNLTAITLS